MTGGHRAEQYRTAIVGIEAFALVSDRAFPRHAHDTFGMGVLREGAHRSWSGVGRVEAGPGDVIAVNPGEMHDGEPLQGCARSWRMLYLEPSIVAQAVPDFGSEAEIVRPVLRDPRLAEHFAGLFQALTELRTDPLELEERILLTLTLLLTRYGSRPLPLATSPTVSRALQRLNEAPERAVTLAELADLSGVSRFQLLRGFARAVGATPHAYLLQQRVRLARRLLGAGLSPAAAAAEAGFADQSHLTRAFRRQFGVTPARYRAALA